MIIAFETNASVCCLVVPGVKMSRVGVYLLCCQHSLDSKSWHDLNVEAVQAALGRIVQATSNLCAAARRLSF